MIKPIKLMALHGIGTERSKKVRRKIKYCQNYVYQLGKSMGLQSLLSWTNPGFMVIAAILSHGTAGSIVDDAIGPPVITVRAGRKAY